MKNVKTTRGLLAGRFLFVSPIFTKFREQEAHVFTDHDRIHELSTLASFNLGAFSAHIFECVCLLLLVSFSHRNVVFNPTRHLSLFHLHSQHQEFEE